MEVERGKEGDRGKEGGRWTEGGREEDRGREGSGQREGWAHCTRSSHFNGLVRLLVTPNQCFFAGNVDG